MKEGKMFGRTIIVRNGDELSPEELDVFNDIADQITTDDYGIWIPVECSSKPEGITAIRRITSEITDYMYVKHPKKNDAQIFEGYYINTSGNQDQIVRYEVVRFPIEYRFDIVEWPG